MARRFLPATAEKLTDAAQEIAEREHIVASTAIASVKYDFISDSVEITFTDGSIYSYSDVPMEVFVGLMRASSKGEFFNANIRNNYSFRRM